MFEVDLAKVTTFLEYLQPSNAMVFVIHNGLAGKTSLKERWYGTPYNYQKMNSSDLLRWEACVNGGSSGVSSALALPSPNPFIPTDFTVHGISDNWATIHQQSLVTGPVVIDLDVVVDDRTRDCFAAAGSDSVSVQDVDCAVADASPDTGGDDNASAGQKESEQTNEGGEASEEEATSNEMTMGTLPPPYGQNRRTWFRQDSKWLVPKANVSIKLQTSYAYCSPLNVALCDMFANVLKEALIEFSYYADCAGTALYSDAFTMTSVYLLL